MIGCRYFQKLGNSNGEAEVLNKIGGLFLLSGETNKAREHFEKALKIYESLKDKNSQADILRVIAQTYASSVSPEQALGYLEKALKLYRETDNRREEAFTLMSLGSLYPLLNLKDETLNAANKEKGKTYLEQASKMLLEEFSGEGELQSLASLMMFGLSENEQEAKEGLKKAYSFYNRQLGKLPNEDTIQFLMRTLGVSMYYFASDDNPKALEYLTKGLGNCAFGE